MKAHSSPDVHMDRQRTQLILPGQIIALRDIGLSIRAIAHQLGVLPRTVSKLIQRWEETGNLTYLARRPRSRVTTTQEDECIRQAAEENPFTNAVAIRDELQLNVSNETVRRRLHEAGMHHRSGMVMNNQVPASKERLTDQHRAARLAFARQYISEGLDFWSIVLFSGEKTFASTNHGQIHLWGQNNTRYVKIPSFMVMLKPINSI
ncbi:Transposable element Tcb2 transposase-like 10 [Homarus americanus]|uniref:Transposable element Tcb2 transposase-like 10 n=1 Tax=Homarus americanus TaxID=6706 RepID=A0A8J5JSV8_HOMAM|nr:Transposable element Tcb2 transposase-like 10 [Homarus americanus]